MSSQNTLVVSTMKDEGPYILEWVAYHRILGFSDFLVYTNDCSDGTDLMLQRLEQLGIVKHEYNKVLRRGPHKSALKHAMDHARFKACDWCFVCDVDEYLNIHYGGGKLADLFAAYQGADVIPVTWRMFSNNGQIDIEDRPLTSSMTDAAPINTNDDAPTAGFVKTLFFRDERLERLGLHRPFFHEDAGETWAPNRPEDDDPLRLVGDLGKEIAQVNHYAVRSAKSFIIKRDRGRANHTSNRIGLDYWERWNAGGSVDRSILRHDAEVMQELARLKADPILAALHDAALKIHRQRAEDILDGDAEARAIFAEIIGGEPAPAAAPSIQPVVADGTPVEHSGDVEVLEPAEVSDVIAKILRKSDENRRAPKRRELRQNMLAELMPKGGKCAEIGVWEGDFSAEIYNITKPRELVLIDPWELLADQSDMHHHSQHSQAAKMREKYDQVSEGLGRIPNVVVRKGFSVEVLNSYPDNYFDWVYIDGNHLYPHVLEDILVSFKKVKPGGIVSGDDLFWKNSEGEMPVRQAVREAMRQFGDQAKQFRRGGQFIIQLND